jgi:lysophospholipase L1-like esterase
VSRKRRLLFVLLNVAVIGVALELLVRLLQLAPQIDPQYRDRVSDPFLPYKPRPGSVITGRSITDEFDYEYRHNALGLRDIDRPVEKPPSTFRICGLGDSFTYGVGVAADAIYLSVLEGLLNARASTHPRVEVLRAGLPRYFAQAEHLLLKHYGLRYAPDLVLIGVLVNDVIDSYLGLDAIVVGEDGYLLTREAARLGRTGAALHEHSHVMRILLGALVQRMTDAAYPVRWDDLYEDGGFHEESWQALEREHGSILETVRSAGAELVLVYIPQAGPWGVEHAYPPERLARWGERHGVLVIDTLPALREASKTQPLYFAKDGHANGAGHAVIARAVFDALVAHELVP